MQRIFLGGDKTFERRGENGGQHYANEGEKAKGPSSAAFIVDVNKGRKEKGWRGETEGE